MDLGHLVAARPTTPLHNLAQATDTLRMRWLVLLALGVMAASCASKAVPQPFPTPGSAPPAGTAKAPAAPAEAGKAAAPVGPALLGEAIAATAVTYRGVPYRNGGDDPSGFDCSGFVQYVLARFGQRVPRATRDQFTAGRRVDKDDIEPGDLVFFTTVAPGASHVGIALDGDEFVHAPNSRGVVRVESLNASYWRTRFIGARRVGSAGGKDRR